MSLPFLTLDIYLLPVRFRQLLAKAEKSLQILDTRCGSASAWNLKSTICTTLVPSPNRDAMIYVVGRELLLCFPPIYGVEQMSGSQLGGLSRVGATYASLNLDFQPHLTIMLVATYKYTLVRSVIKSPSQARLIAASELGSTLLIEWQAMQIP